MRRSSRPPDGMPALAVVPCHCGGEAEAEAALKPLRTFGPPLMDAVQRMPFTAMQRLLDDAFPDGAHNYWKSTFVRELSDEVIDLLVEHANKARSPMSAVVVETLQRCGRPGGPGRDGLCPAAGGLRDRRDGAVDRCRRCREAHRLDARANGRTGPTSVIH